MSRALIVAELREVNVPFFPGFYESHLSRLLDNEEEAVVEHLTSDDTYGDARFRGRDLADVHEALYFTTNYPRAFSALARDWVENLSYVTPFEEDATFTYADMESPRQYNFSTDRVFARVTLDAVRHWYRRVDPDQLDDVAAERHTSRSGFISFYDPDWRTWGPVEDWDVNHLGTLLVAYIRTLGADTDDVEMDLEDALVHNARFGDALDSALDLDAAAARLREAA